MLTRDKYPTRSIRLVGELQRDTAITLLQTLPLDAKKPLVITIGEDNRTRSQQANALMWAGTLKDISEQAYVNGRTYSSEVWHEMFKEHFLPNELEFVTQEERDQIVKPKYRKWDVTPSGKKILVGSTTELTIKGFAIYLQKVESYGASIGVIFHTVESEWR